MICSLSTNLNAQFSIDVFGGGIYNLSTIYHSGGIGSTHGLSTTYCFHPNVSTKTTLNLLSEKSKNKQHQIENRLNMVGISCYVGYSLHKKFSVYSGFFYRYAYQHINKSYGLAPNSSGRYDNGLCFQLKYLHSNYFAFLTYNIGLANRRHYSFDISNEIQVFNSRSYELGVGYNFSNL